MTEPLDIAASLDDRVREFTATNLERPGVVTAWVLCVATSRIDDDGDMCFAYDYSVSPDTDLIRSVGLVELCRDRIKRHITSGDDDS